MKIAIKAAAAALFACFFTFTSSAQTILYSENFILPDGTTQGTGTPPNWTLSGNPIFWDHFEVRSNQMEANKISIEGAWLSKTFDITGFTDVTLSVDLSSAGSLSSGDYIRGFYKLNGGSEVQWFNITGSTALVTKTFNGISGGSLQVVIRMRNDNGETWFFDNVTVTGNCATNAGTTSVSQTVISSGQTVDLALTGHNGSIQWQQSTDNVTFTDIAGGTTTPFTTAQLTGPGVFYFRAKVTNVCASFSNVVTVTVNEASTTISTDSLHATRFVTVGNTIVLEGTVPPAANHIYTEPIPGPGTQPFSDNLFVQNSSRSVSHTIFGNRVGIGPFADHPVHKLHLFDQFDPLTSSLLGIRMELFNIQTNTSAIWDLLHNGEFAISHTGAVNGAPLRISTTNNVVGFSKTGILGQNYEGGPRLKLDVAGDARFGPDNNNYIRIGFNGSAIIDNFASGPNNLLINHFSGNDVSIGNGTNKSNLIVGGKLHVAGDIRTDGTRMVINGFNGANNFWFGTGAAEPDGLFMAFTGTPDGPAEAVLIAPGGAGSGIGLYVNREQRVGINNITPRATLDVNGRAIIGSSTQVAGPHTDYTLAVDGKIVAKDVILKLEDWADYVCDSAYALMSPAEMKAFISKYKHLPGMPSERELLQRGLDIKEMQRLQQVKIEEYAKYIILLNERLTELEKKNALLEKKMQQRKGLRETRKAKRTLKNMPR